MQGERERGKHRKERNRERETEERGRIDIEKAGEREKLREEENTELLVH